MATKTSCSYNEMLQRYADEYYEETHTETATTKEIAKWAIQTDRWSPPADLVLKKCREEFSKALREQYFHDAHGQPVRAKHVARTTVADKQLHLWADIRRAPRQHMEAAFQQQREQIVGDCRQLNRDVEYYNGAHPDHESIQLVFDFTDDLEEAQFSGEFPPKKPR